MSQTRCKLEASFTLGIQGRGIVRLPHHTKKYSTRGGVYIRKLIICSDSYSN